jgi:DNA repair protein SbcC/Rad50
MIPLQLTLKNFLSYREATLDFRGLHTACVCGPNGSGKSSLLEAIAWVVWGQSRAASEDDVIHLGAKEAQVDFLFESREDTYRVMRTRTRNQATALELQVATENGWRSLTERGVRATQHLILQHLKLDYDTFVNSAYLRQGRADEFMLKRPSERKQILTDLLKLAHYDELAEQAKDLARELKGKADLVEQNLASMQEQLQQRSHLAQEQRQLDAQIVQMQGFQAQLTEDLQALQRQQQQQQTWQQQLAWQQQQAHSLTQELQRVQQEFAQAQQQQRNLAALLEQERAIAQGYANWQTLQIQDEQLSQTFQAYQKAQAQHQRLQQQQAQQISALNDQLRQIQAQFNADSQQEQEMAHILAKQTDVEAALENLRKARNVLTDFDQRQAEATPLLQRRQALQTQIDRLQARQQARLEELKLSKQQLQHQHARQPHLERSLQDITAEIERLDKRRVYHQRVREKGQERRSFLDQLKAHQKDYETQLATLEPALEFRVEANATCPLCDRPLDEPHWQRVQQKHKAQQQELRDQLWVIREQLAVSDREIQVLRQEYREVEQELAPYGSILEQRGQLQAQLQAVNDAQQKLEAVETEMDRLQRSLETVAYGTELQAEQQALDQTLQTLNYDERNHALARSDVERQRWAEIKHAEIRQAQQRQTQIAARQPRLQAQVDDLRQQLDRLQGIGAFVEHPAEIQEQIRELDRYLAELGYSAEAHNTLRVHLRQAQTWQWRYQELQQAQQTYPQLQQRIAYLQQTLQTRTQELQVCNTQIEHVTTQLQTSPDCANQIQVLEAKLQQQRQLLDQQLGQLGRLQQQIHHLEGLQTHVKTQQQQLQTLRRQYRIYQELTQAFGKNGIQALMIENVLPQLEAETNQILSRLSANQLHIQFVTQRASRREQGRTAKSKHQAAKLIDTLDILIADLSGTRPYETYSGGEAFRVNFAIRLALARLLAQRSGTALQMLIIDEGFGTQDQEGCDRLIAAINAISPDFACILTVTHMPHLKEAFQTRIEVAKTANGSQLTLVV